MRTTDLFKSNRAADKITETIEKVFGKKLNLESFDLEQLEDARNKLRTQIHTVRSESGFNENLENDAFTQAQWMLDAINSEIAERQEFISDPGVAALDEAPADVYEMEYMFTGDDGETGDGTITYEVVDGEIDPTSLKGYCEGDGNNKLNDDWCTEMVQPGGYEHEEALAAAQEDYAEQSGNQEPDDNTDDGYALASAGFGSDEDYESINNEGESKYTDVSIAQDVYADNPDLDSEDDILNAAFPHVVKMMGGNKKRANYMFNYDEDFPGEMISAYKWLQRQAHDVGEATGRDSYQRDYDASVSGMGRRERENDEGDTEPANNFAVSINGKQWKVFKGRGQYADDSAERKHYRQLKDWAAKKSESTGKKWEVHVTGAPATESINQKEDMNTNEAYINNAKDAINLLADIRKQSKMAELGQGDPVRPNQLVNDLYDVMQWIEANMKESVNTESVTTGDIMTRLQEGEVQQATAVVTAKTMVDRVGRWIEELSGMENDQLIQLGDSIRDEMGQEQAKAYISAVAPAVQQALENLKTTRETLATGVRMLTGEEQGAELLGSEPAPDAGGIDDLAGPAEPDALNAEPEMADDEFAAADAAVGGAETAGREKRESINYQNSLLKVLAG